MNFTRTRIGVRTCLLPVLRADSQSGGAAPTVSTVGFPDSTAILLPVAWAGVWAGNRVHVRLAPAVIARIIGAVLFITGVTLVIRTV